MGAHIDDKLSWNIHIDHAAQKISSAIGGLRRVKPFVPLKTMHTIYNALIQPHFDYCDVVWANINKGLADRIQKLQNRSARIITGSRIRSPYGQISPKTQWNAVQFQTCSFVQNTWDNAQKAAWHRILVLDDEETRSTLSSLSHGSGRSQRSTGSNLSPKDTWVNIKAKRAVLQQKLRFCEAVKEQEKTLEKLKLEQEFSETVAEEEVYETAVHEDESQLPSRPPLESLDVLNFYLQDEGAPRRSSLTAIQPSTSSATQTVRVTISPLASHPTFVQHRPEASRTPTPRTSPVSSTSPNTAVDDPPGNAQPRDESASITFTFPQPRPAETPSPSLKYLRAFSQGKKIRAQRSLWLSPDQQ